MTEKIESDMLVLFYSYGTECITQSLDCKYL